jgi:transposase
MPARRISMRKIREVLRLLWVCDLGQRQISRSTCVSKTTVGNFEWRAKRAGLTWDAVEEMSDTDLENLLFSEPGPARGGDYVVPDWSKVHTEMQRKGVTLALLWDEYKELHSEGGYQYSRFCDLYQGWRGKLDLSMRQVHRAGEKLFVDYSGQTVPVVDPSTGGVRDAEIFVAVLGASNYTFAEATWSQSLPDWISSHVRAFSFFGGVSEILVPDNLKSGIDKPCRYEPDVNTTYHELAVHYGAAVIPARVRKPKDKAKVEVGVQIAERWILARLRNRTFFCLEELNTAIAELLERLNGRPFQKLPGTRRTRFEEIDKPALKPLPATRYEYAEWTKVRVGPDYHVAVDGSYYSVPYELVKTQLEARATATTVEILHKGKRVASHRRSTRKGQYSTLPEHMPRSHRAYAEWTPERVVSWASKSGPSVVEMVKRVMESRPHPQQGFRSCLGIIRLGKAYGNDRLEAACRRGLAIGAQSYKSIASILKQGLDSKPLDEPKPAQKPIDHDNVRGPRYYGREAPSC